jgi:prepilin-type N-terminal cleavage/methylation domain-containing protein
MSRLRGYLSYLSKTGSEKGMTLVELLVVCVLLSILAGISVALISQLFDSNLRSQQAFDQQQTINSTFGFLSAKLATAQRPPNTLTRPCGSGTCIDYRAIGPDQLVFSSGGICYRMTWIKDLRQIRLASSGSCGDASIRPKRLPNQTIGDAFADLGQSCPTSPSNYCELFRLPLSEKTNAQYTGIYDPPLDEVTGATPGSSLLASGINPPPSDGASPFVFIANNGTSRLAFTYTGTGSGVDRNAKNCTLYVISGTPPSPCTTVAPSDPNRTAADDIAQVAVSTYILPTLSTQPVAQAATRLFSQQYSLQQVCAATATGGSTATPGTVYNDDFVKGTPTQATFRSVVQSSSYGTVDLGDASTSPLQSVGYVPQQNELIKFTGAVNIAGPTAGSVGETDVRATLYQQDGAGAPVVATDSNGTQNYTFSTQPAVPGRTYATVSLQGTFLVPLNSAQPTRKFFVRVEIRSLSSGTITYSTQATDMWLNTQWVAST